MTWLARQIIPAMICLLLAQNITPQADKQKPIQSEDEPIKLHTTLVQVPVIVKESGGRYLTDLKKDEFTIYEDGVKRDLAFFGTVEQPFNVALLIDSSGSTVEQLERIKTSALAFIDNLRPQDKVMVVEFNDSVRILSELTGDRQRIERAIAEIKPGEYTQVFEAVYTAVWEKLAQVEGRKAVILFSDGIDNASSEIEMEDTLDAVIESEDVIVYPIRYSTRADVERKIEKKFTIQVTASNQKAQEDYDKALRELDRSYREADEYLTELARLSGGVVERADQLTDLKAAFGRIADELRRQYVLGYYPPDKDGDKERRISVSVSRQGAIVRARPGYRVTQ
ncbi:MAG TPA: VWA domain-containing protein [Blastocatellia bacterium]|nr:VWA domain-containing protein [Blastocatellia bacterium]